MENMLSLHPIVKSPTSLWKIPSQRPPPVRWKIRLRTNSMFCFTLMGKPRFPSSPVPQTKSIRLQRQQSLTYRSPSGWSVEHLHSSLKWCHYISTGRDKYVTWKIRLKITNCVFPRINFPFSHSLSLWWKTCCLYIQLSKPGLRVKNMLFNDLLYFPPLFTSCIFPPRFLSIPFNNYCSALFAQGVSFEGPCCGFCVCCCMFQNTTPLSLSSISQRFCELAFLPRMSSVCGQAAVTQAPLETSHCWLLVMFHTFLQIPRIRWGLRNFRWRGLLGCFQARGGVGQVGVFTLKMTRGGTKSWKWQERGT